MQEEKPCCAAAVVKKIRKLKLLSGSQVGIVNLENVLKEIAGLKLLDDEAIKRELLKKVKIYNYVAPAVQDDYVEALFREYERETKGK